MAENLKIDIKSTRELKHKSQPWLGAKTSSSQRPRKQLISRLCVSFRIVIGGVGSVFLIYLCKLFALGTVMGKPFRLFNVTMETIQEKFHLGCNSKISFTQKSSYPRVANYFPEAKSSSVL